LGDQDGVFLLDTGIVVFLVGPASGNTDAALMAGRCRPHFAQERLAFSTKMQPASSQAFWMTSSVSRR